MSAYGDTYNVQVKTGVLVTCDSAAKQILLHLDSQREGPRKFLVRDIDETHVMIKREYVEEIKELLQDELEKNTYVQDPNL
ncbi:hypothetical protein IAU60_005634 [Kwoniella sp. DSM 27419]